jgi:steroid 5-alpha reductase family enzyme
VPGAIGLVMLAAFATGTALRRHNVADIAWGVGFAAVAVVCLVISAGQGLAARPGRRY